MTLTCFIQNSANIIVQNRMTGQLEEEKMQVYVRLGIRLLYKVRRVYFSLRPGLMSISGCHKSNGRRTRYVFTISSLNAAYIESIARRLLKSLSIKQGIKYDSPESARDIPQFIQFHGLKVDEIQDPLDSFSTCTKPLSNLSF